MNIDCWYQVLSSLSPSARASARLVCREWCDMIDFLDSNQNNLQIVLADTSETLEKTEDDDSSIITCRLHYDTFCRLFDRFGRHLKSVSVKDFDRWSDHHLLRLVKRTNKLTCFKLINCRHFGGSDDNHFGFQSVTSYGWTTLITSYSHQLEELVLEDCDLESRHLALIAANFRHLRCLNVANNSGITNYSSLSLLTETIETLKIGPKLSISKRRLGHRYEHYEMPIETIVAWATTNNANCRLKSLQLQGYLTARLQRLASIESLRELSIKYVSFCAQDLFNYEMDVLVVSLRQMRHLDSLCLYQYNASNSEPNEMQWIREQLLEHNRSTACACATMSSAKSPPALKSFSLSTKHPLLVIDQFRLLNFVLTACVRLESLSLISARFDVHHVHSNVNQTVLTLLAKHGQRLKQLRLENIFCKDSLNRLLTSFVVANVCPRLERLVVDDANANSLLHGLVSIATRSDVRRSNPLQLVFTTQRAAERLRSFTKIFTSHNQRALDNVVHVIFRTIKRDELAVSEESDEDGDLIGHGVEAHQVSQGHYQDDDLSDLCQLIDTGFDLIGNLVDLLSMVANCGGLVVTYWMLLKPVRFLNFTKRIFRLCK